MPLDPRTLLSSPLFALQELFGAERVTEMSPSAFVWHISSRHRLGNRPPSFDDGVIALIDLLGRVFPGSELAAGDSPAWAGLPGTWIETGARRWGLPADVDAGPLWREWLFYEYWSLSWPARRLNRHAPHASDVIATARTIRSELDRHELSFLLHGEIDAEFLIFAVDPVRLRQHERERFQ